MKCDVRAFIQTKDQARERPIDMKVHELQGEEQPAVVQPIIRFQLSFYMQI
jgi:hypothetical protein